MHELVAAIARDPQTVGWESWLTLLSEAIANEEAWLRAIDAMALEDQFVLIDALKSDDSIYSDALQVLTARRANAISDEEVRDFLLTDASDASERFGNRLQRQREQLLALISSATARREADFDLAEEVTTLEMQLQELRRSEIGEKFEAMQKLDVEIHRLEAFQRSLERYDADARRNYRNTLQAETDQLASERKGIEEGIATSIGQRDTLQRERDESHDRLEELEGQNEVLKGDIARINDEIAVTSGQLADARAQCSALRSQLSTLAAELEDQRRQLADEVRRLDELRSSPSARTSQQLLQTIEEVYALLPADMGEAQFGS